MDDRDDLGDAEFLKLIFKEIYPAFDADDNYGIYLRMLIEMLYRMNDDRLAVQLQELLRDITRMHSLTRASCEYQCDIHMYNLT